MPESKLLVINNQRLEIAVLDNGQMHPRDVLQAAQALAISLGEPFDLRHRNQVQLVFEGRDQFTLKNVPIAPTPPARELPTKPPIRELKNSTVQPAKKVTSTPTPSTQEMLRSTNLGETFIGKHLEAVIRGFEAIDQIEARGFSHQKEEKGYPVIGKVGPKALWDREGLYISAPRLWGDPITHRVTHADIASGKATIKVPKRTFEGLQQYFKWDWMGSIKIELPQRDDVAVTIHGVEKPMSTIQDIIKRASEIVGAQDAQAELQALVVRRPESMHALLQLERNIPISTLLHGRL